MPPSNQTSRSVIGFVIVLFTSSCQCDERRAAPISSGEDASAPQPSTKPVPEAEPSGKPPRSEESAAALRERQARAAIAEALAKPGLVGATSFEEKRGVLLARAKNEPVFFVQTPEDVPASDEITYYRSRVRTARSTWTALGGLLPFFERNPEKARQILLRDGYLYAEDPDLAFSLVGRVSAHHLFDDPVIWIQRGQSLMRAERKGYRYVFSDGPHSGSQVRLLHLDRLGAGTVPSAPALHRDFRTLRLELAFDRARVRHITKEHLVVDLRYGGQHWVPTLLRAEGPRLHLEHEVIPQKKAGDIDQARSAAQRRQRLVQLLRQAMLEQVAEALPFDEPRTEIGQQDGILRRAWRFAYNHQREQYRVNGDSYPVFDAEGRPRVPQVCMDFLLDTFERASGTWYAPQEAQRARTRGTLDFEDEGSRWELRRTMSFLKFAADNPQWFDVLEIPPHERIEMGWKPRFFSYLSRHADDYAPGDMVFIRGKTPWDDREEHTHAFFVYETDPLTGVPIAVAGNADTPAVWSFETEARRTPLRTLRQRVRPTDALLELVGGGLSSSALSSSLSSPPPLALGD